MRCPNVLSMIKPKYVVSCITDSAEQVQSSTEKRELESRITIQNVKNSAYKYLCLQNTWHLCILIKN